LVKHQYRKVDCLMWVTLQQLDSSLTNWITERTSGAWNKFRINLRQVFN